MKKTFFYLLIFSQVFGQSIIDTLSVTVYPEFSYPGVAIEYKFDKSNNNDITFPIPANIDSVLYTISTDSLEFEKIVQGISKKIITEFKNWQDENEDKLYNDDFSVIYIEKFIHSIVEL